MSQSIRVLSEEDLERVNARISLLEADESQLNKRSREELRALRRAKAGFEILEGLRTTRIFTLKAVPTFVLAAMDANSSRLDQPNVLPTSYATMLAELQALMSSYGIRIEGLELSWDPARITRSAVVEKLLTQQPEPEQPPTPTVIVHGKQPRAIHLSTAQVAGMLDRWPDTTILVVSEGDQTEP